MAEFYSVKPTSADTTDWVNSRPKNTPGLFKASPTEAQSLPDGYIGIGDYYGKRSDWAKFAGLDTYTVNRRYQRGDRSWDLIRPVGASKGVVPSDLDTYFEKRLTSLEKTKQLHKTFQQLIQDDAYEGDVVKDFQSVHGRFPDTIEELESDVRKSYGSSAAIECLAELKAYLGITN